MMPMGLEGSTFPQLPEAPHLSCPEDARWLCRASLPEPPLKMDNNDFYPFMELSSTEQLTFLFYIKTN